jgi:hypothetical protein
MHQRGNTPRKALFPFLFPLTEAQCEPTRDGEMTVLTR